MPIELSETIFLILNDVCLNDSFKSINSILTTLLSHLDPDLSEINSLSTEICGSIQASCQFLMQSDDLVIESSLFLFLNFENKFLNYISRH